jgi:hypothetical protein
MNAVDIGQLSPVTRMREAGLTVAPIPRARTSTVAGLHGLVATEPAAFAAAVADVFTECPFVHSGPLHDQGRIVAS